MTGLAFHIEPFEAPGVGSRLLASTWSRIEIHIGEECVTEHALDGAIFRGVFGSAFPLARRLVDNWWMLLHESCHAIHVARSATARPDERAWYQRHSFRAIGDGFAWPELLLFRDQDQVAARWYVDSATRDRPAFLRNGHASLSVTKLAAEFARVIPPILERCDDKESAEYIEVATRWDAIRSTPVASAEARALNRAAALGLDAWDETEVDDRLYEGLEQLGSWSNALRRDFLDGVEPASFGDAAEAISRVLKRTSKLVAGDGVDGRLRKKLPARNPSQPAHLHGYAVARAARKHMFGRETPAPAELDQAAKARFPHVLKQPDLVQWGIRAVVSPSTLVVDPLSQKDSIGRRFAQARSLYALWTSVEELQESRILSSAETYFQSAGRSFAAEWLAPADLLRPRVRPRMATRDVRVLAQEFQVDPKVIEHQIENHQLASLSMD